MASSGRLRHGIWTLIFGGTIPLGGSREAGVLADFIGTPATMAIGALICALAALVTLHIIRPAGKPNSPQRAEVAAPTSRPCRLSIVSR